MRLLLAAALLPPLFLMFMIYKMDKIEHEPVGLIVKLFVFGALSCIPAAIIEVIGDAVLGTFIGAGSILYAFIDAFFIVALAEEGVKHFVLKRITWKHPAFDYHFDGVVYAVAASLGFAALENIMYICLEGASLSAGLSLAVSRGLMSIPGHCIFGIFMGISYSRAKHAERMQNPGQTRKRLKRSMLIPVLLHGFYDFCLFTGEDLFIVVFFIFIILLDIIAYRRIRQFAREDTPV